VLFLKAYILVVLLIYSLKRGIKMADYRESTVTGTQWTRSNVVVINNDFGKPPKITFGEETRIAIGDGSIQASTSAVSCEFDAENPAHIELYTKLNDLYTILRELRDNPPVVEPIS